MNGALVAQGNEPLMDSEQTAAGREMLVRLKNPSQVDPLPEDSEVARPQLRELIRLISAYQRKHLQF